MPWRDHLYLLDYVRNPGAGVGGLHKFSLDSQGMITKTTLANHTTCYANRMIHLPTKSIVMGPYIIGDGSDSTAPEFRKLKGMEKVRIGGMAEHLTKQDDSVYLLGMEGEFWEGGFGVIVTSNLPTSTVLIECSFMHYYLKTLFISVSNDTCARVCNAIYLLRTRHSKSGVFFLSVSL